MATLFHLVQKTMGLGDKSAVLTTQPPTAIAQIITD